MEGECGYAMVYFPNVYKGWANLKPGAGPQSESATWDLDTQVLEWFPAAFQSVHWLEAGLEELGLKLRYSDMRYRCPKRHLGCCTQCLPLASLTKMENMVSFVFQRILLSMEI